MTNLSTQARDSSTPRYGCCAPHTATTPHPLWCSVLSDPRSTRSRSSIATSLNAPYDAPYFLTVSRSTVRQSGLTCLNAPYGAPCFLTPTFTHQWREAMGILMYLMVLHAFCHGHTICRQCNQKRGLDAPYGAPYFLTPSREPPEAFVDMRSQCTLWRSVLSDATRPTSRRTAFFSLNAPYGAPCFLTCMTCRGPISCANSLNAPYGAPCFLTGEDVTLGFVKFEPS